MSEDFDRNELLSVFIAETEENLATLEQMLMVLEAEPSNAEVIHSVFRAAHTLKGNAACVGFDPLARIAHAMENVLDCVRDGKTEATSVVINALLEATDEFRSMLPAVLAGMQEVSETARGIISTLDEIAQGTFVQSASPLAPVAAGRDEGTTVTLSRRLRVDLERLDVVMNLIGEITVSRRRIAAAVHRLRSDDRDDLIELVEQNERLLVDLHDEITRMRLVPIGFTFDQYKRTIRDLARETGKELTLRLEGQDVEIDASLAEQIRDPLTHMIRNSVDHGIETPEMRIAAGKPPAGTITLRARHDGAEVIIEVSDDGRGLDRRSITARARERGLIAPDHEPSEDEIHAIVFAPGFSTAVGVTDLSGRGVGMDVVKRRIAELRGSVHVRSTFGEGATLSMRVPLTLAAITGLAFRSGRERFIVPMHAIERCVDLEWTGDLLTGAGILDIDGQPLPCVRVSSFFHLPLEQIPARHQTIIVRDADRRIGLMVDELIGEAQAIIKPLGKLFRQLPGIAGSTILEDGKVGLIIDIPGLIREATQRDLRAVN